MSGHTPEPWKINLVTLAAGYPIDAAQTKHAGGSERICSVRAANRSDDAYDEAEANARRIVACVNACAGIPTDDLEQNIIECAADHLEGALNRHDSPGMRACLAKLRGEG